ncbi:MAG: ABC transporter ATP-binding protein [Bacilli bacterium]|nr:ABC transporter ATP-binding protein [Bacilli bacterium]
MIKLDKVSKIYYNNGVIGTGFTKVSTEFKMGEFVAILGESGSGKSTLLNVISGLDSYEEGEMYINGEETSHYAEEDFEEYRRKYVANIFQAFNLVNSYSVRQNVELVLLINGNSSKESKKSVDAILKKVGLWELRNKKVSKLSGGQKQRVAIARALAKETPIIVADEPTGNLDQASAKAIFELLNEISKDKLVIVVTHNFDQIEPYATRILRMHDGKLIEDKKVRKTDVIEAKESNYKKMNLASKLLLSFRNAFNVLPKFLITLAVFIIITITLLGEYASFKNDEYNEFANTVYDVFNDTAPERIIVNKKDKSIISNEDIKNVKNIDNVADLKVNDYLYDLSIEMNFKDDYYVAGAVMPISNFKANIDEGRMPENENEIVVVTNKDHFDVSQFYLEGWFNVSGNLYLMNSGNSYAESVKVVGISYDDKAMDHTFYVGKKVMDYIENAYLLNCNDVVLKLKQTRIQGNGSSLIGISAKVPVGEVYVNLDSINGVTDINGENLNIEATSIYNKVSKDFKVTKTYTSESAKKHIGSENYNAIVLNPKDIVELLESDVYQMSVYAKDVDSMDNLIEELKNKGYNAFAVKDTGYVSNELLAIFRVMNYFAIAFVIFVLFGVSYYIIYLVLKSRVTYFAVVRMLGGNVKLNKQLVNIELFIDATIGFIITLLLIFLTHANVIHIEALKNAISFLKVQHFIIVYLILVIMSQLLARKYARKIFKDSMITTYNMEV